MLSTININFNKNSEASWKSALNQKITSIVFFVGSNQTFLKLFLRNRYNRNQLQTGP